MGKDQRIYWRERGGEKRAYGDFRDYGDVGGGQEALIPEGAKRATTDADLAQALVTARIKELDRRRRLQTLHDLEREETLKDFAIHHLQQKKMAGKVTEKHIKAMKRHLQDACEFLGESTDVASIRVEDVRAYMNDLRQRPSRVGGTLSDSTVLKHLVSLSNMFRRAQSEGVVQPGYNPVSALMDKPSPEQREAEWLEVHEAAALLETARRFKPKEHHPRTFAHIYPIIATFLLTGMRRSELRGLEVRDVNFGRKTITVRPNGWRRVKTKTSRRPVPIWPQLEEILTTYLDTLRPKLPGDTLLFPAEVGPRKAATDEEKMFTNLHKVLDTLAEKAGLGERTIRTKVFRHTYCAARLQTLDNGHPVAKWTVAKELGHGGNQLVERVYGHLGRVRHRSEELEYRVEHHEVEVAKLQPDWLQGANHTEGENATENPE